MDDILIARGFTQCENPGYWKKNDWIIRFFGNEFEIYEDKELGKYLYGDLRFVDWNIILNEI